MRKSLTFMATIILVLTAASASLFAADAGEAGAARQVININTANATQFALLPRVGPKAAERIVQYRKENGSFKKTTDLMQVKGIGDKTFELLNPYLVVDGKTTLSAKQHGPRKPRSKRASVQPSNTAQ